MMYLIILFYLMIRAVAAASISSYPCPPALADSQPPSLHMIASIVSRRQGISNNGLSTGQIELGIFQSALRYALIQYPQCSQNLSTILGQSLSSTVAGLENVTIDATYPLDRFSIANALLHAQFDDLNSSNTLTYSETVTYLLLSESVQPRNYLGGYWYYSAYPNWSYLDGMYSVAPFTINSVLLLNESIMTDTSKLTDITLQFSLLYSHCLHPNTSLLVHGYDALKTAVWANRISGASPNVWGRSLGWYVTGLVETLALLSSSPSLSATPQFTELHGIFTTLCGAIMKAADPLTGAWWQMMEYPGQSGNFLESSSTSLFIFAILKGVRLGFLVDPTASAYTAGALKAYSYALQNFVQPEGNGTLEFAWTVSVCSLNSSATYDYYVSRPILLNSLIGTSAFVHASLEVEMLDPGYR